MKERGKKRQIFEWHKTQRSTLVSELKRRHQLTLSRCILKKIIWHAWDLLSETQRCERFHWQNIGKKVKEKEIFSHPASPNITMNTNEAICSSIWKTTVDKKKKDYRFWWSDLADLPHNKRRASLRDGTPRREASTPKANNPQNHRTKTKEKKCS